MLSPFDRGLTIIFEKLKRSTRTIGLFKHERQQRIIKPIPEHGSSNPIRKTQQTVGARIEVTIRISPRLQSQLQGLWLRPHVHVPTIKPRESGFFSSPRDIN